ncbi:hypothetical protein MAPG_03551, partial [Magnaporthiopsis poae ATCC 64411]
MADDSKKMATRGRKKAARHLELHHARHDAEQLRSDQFLLSSPTAVAALFHELQSAATTTSIIRSKAVAGSSSQSPNGTMPALSTETTLTPSSLGLVQMFGQETDSIHVVTVTVAAGDITALTTAAPTASDFAGVVATTGQGTQESRTANQDQQEKPSDGAWKAAVIIVCTLTALSVAAYFIYRIWKKRQSRKSAGAQRIDGDDERDVAARPRTRTNSYANRPPTPFRPSGPAAETEDSKGPGGHGASFWSPQRNHPNSHAFPDFPPPMGLPRSLSTYGRPALEPVGIANATDNTSYGYAASTGNGFPAAQTQSTIVVSDEGMMTYPPGQGKIHDDVLNTQSPQDGHDRAAALCSTFANDASVVTTAAASEESSYFPYNEQGFYVSPAQKRFPPSPAMDQQQPFRFDSPGSTNLVATYTTAPPLNSFASTSPGHGLKRQSMDDNDMPAVVTGHGPFVFHGDTDAATDADDKTETQDQPPAKKPRLADETNETRLDGAVDGKSPTAISHHGSVSSR